ncbi:hypothetical protein Ccar_20570 [Clostridium carboxidivorans P7]|uniref:Uncharacterized protein n=1 Tax=Clostridium carboxidivorans P7 TaxID=536227 RepID=C6Q1K5_9CLOT|nr:hypothetical protein [Clostridium carboxidivorans]AKN33107.1 hypothetical protein Ccar_20570 [Clostridium carboxidivorans P7]EET84622.1 hypothetical protein CcarbDRAFT_4923 [Clostridium carboxidivorans P7]EFG87965.1 hypothetical protein CLCAR_2283 [Clostridium carboxidivorans P7]
MDNSIVIDEINFWDSELSKLGSSNNKLYELAFFKVFVKFDLFLTQLFVNYSVGKGSSKGYIPQRKLEFIDEKHLEGILINKRSSFIDYSEKIPQLSKYIFRDGNDPFSLVFSDSNFSTYYNKMKYIRNYIAHESNESKKKYHKSVIMETNSFIEPYVFLSKIDKKHSKTNYSVYISIIRDMTETLLDPTSYFGTSLENNTVQHVAATLDDNL